MRGKSRWFSQLDGYVCFRNMSTSQDIDICKEKIEVDCA